MPEIINNTITEGHRSDEMVGEQKRMWKLIEDCVEQIRNCQVAAGVFHPQIELPTVGTSVVDVVRNIEGVFTAAKDTLRTALSHVDDGEEREKASAYLEASLFE